ncbi:pyruvate:ferredoxin (flavodoxin) oxidoreductase [Uliginosibacterium flavum]|uniref:Pyruvate-flavodoxin oxidoreductase n=1 Tax=Uliginosibacterium flavum TaxID=1396831 RepID=A0ABV2TMS0_9RHOO
MTKLTIDGNQAAAIIAYQFSEVIAIYPITPASAMGEWADEWAAAGDPNLWGSVPQVIEMQSEAGAAGAIHGALQAGALATTFTASQGLLLMLPNMYRIAGELTPTVFHVAARALATQALSIFGDHSDVMSARQTGFGLLCANCPQEAMDLALIAHAASLEGRIPVLHFFDGFRTSHELARVDAMDAATLRAMIRPEWIAAHRARALSPAHPVLHGSAQNPDVAFQTREAVNPYYERFPAIVQGAMDRFANLTGRHYRLFEYVGSAYAERVIVLMGSGAETAAETVDYLERQGEAVGLLKVRLYRPFDAAALIAALPERCHSIAVLDRCKEPGADGEPLYKDVLAALTQHCLASGQRLPRIIGGRYGLSSKEFTPGMVKRVFDELCAERPHKHFTIGIHDDVTQSSLDWDAGFRTDAHARTFQAVFYGLGSDGTVSANKNSIQIIGEATPGYVQGYFVYDSKKSGAVTISHLRFGSDPIHSAYLIGEGEANFVACHQSLLLDRYALLDTAADQAVFLLNSPLPPAQVWAALPPDLQGQIVARQIRLYAIDAYAVAEQAGLGTRINTIMQACFFAIAGILPRDQALAAIKDSVKKSYGKKERRLIELNCQAIDNALAHLQRIEIGPVAPPRAHLMARLDRAPAFVREVSAEIIAGRGDALPVSRLPADGTFPLGTAAFEKRNLAQQIPVWEADLCIQCGKCPLVCPHAAIRCKAVPPEALSGKPTRFKHVAALGKDFPPGWQISYQVAPEDCTGCTLCVDICPIRDKVTPARKALNMAPKTPALVAAECDNWDYFLSLPEYDRRALNRGTIKGAMLLQPLFEFSGACVGCGETPYLKLVTQLFGDRMIVANATGCSSIYGGNLPTTPWSQNAEGRGPAWCNSLFEDNAEFGLGIRVALDQQAQTAARLLSQLREQLPVALVDAIRQADQSDEAGLHEQRARVAQLRAALKTVPDARADTLLDLADKLCRHSVWIIGGDGWAYDIGFGGLDHVLASGKDVNILVLNNEVYANTGGQTSKATPRGAVARFSASGKARASKDLARFALNYPDVYVAQIAYGAKDVQTLRAVLEAEAYPGPALIIAYAPCIAHGVELVLNHQQQDLAVRSGHWPLFRFDPRRAQQGKNPLHLDSPEPSIPYRDFALSEARFSRLWQTHPQDAERLLQQAQDEARQRFRYYQQLAEHWQAPAAPGAPAH